MFFKIAWAVHYNGKKSDVLRGGHSHLKAGNRGAERANFLKATDGWYYGYAPHKKKGGQHSSLSIERFGAEANDKYIDGVDVAFIAPGPNGVELVGWYENARVYRDVQRNGGNRLPYTVRAKRAQKISPALRMAIDQKLSSAAIWYADNRPDIVADVRAFMAGNYSPPIRKGKANKPDRENILAVERAAVQAVFTLFGNRGYDLSDRSSEKVGWDVEAVLGKERLRIEVKGCSGSAASAELTPNEYHHSTEHANYRICIVTHALTSPKVHIFQPYDDGSWWNEDGDRELFFEERTAARISA